MGGVLDVDVKNYSGYNFVNGTPRKVGLTITDMRLRFRKIAIFKWF